MKLPKALRIWRSRPGLVTGLIALLALGALFASGTSSLVHAVLLRPLPFPEPDRILVLQANSPQIGFTGSFLNVDQIDLWRESAESSTHVAAFAQRSAVLEAGGDPRRIATAWVEDPFFDILGITPLIGQRELAPHAAEATPPVLLSEDLWRRLGADPAILGRTLTLNATEHRVIGVLPRRAAAYPEGTEAWLAVTIAPGEPRAGIRMFNGLARLAPGATPRQAEQELTALAPPTPAGQPTDPWLVESTPVRETLVGDVRRQLLIALAGALLVFLVAAANATSIHLLGTLDRQEVRGIQRSLGATRKTLLRQAAAEMAWIAAATILLATPIALGLVTSFTALLPTSFPRLDPATLRLGALALTPLYVLLGSLLVLTPSILAVLREDTRLVLGRLAAPLSGVSRRLRTVHGSFLFVQVALTVVLSIGASLLVVSVWKLQHVDVHFDKEDVLTLAVPLSDDRYAQDEPKIQFFDTALDRIRRLPGVASAGMVSGLPFNGALMVSPVTTGPAPEATEENAVQATVRVASPDYLTTLRLPLLEGRPITPADRKGSKPVALINQRLAEAKDGKTFTVGEGLRIAGLSDEPWEIVGVVANARQTGFDQDSEPEIYVPYAQYPVGRMELSIRGDDPRALVTPVRETLRSLDSRQLVEDIQTLEELIYGSTSRGRFYATLLALFAALSLVLVVSGIFGALGYWVRSRSREIGVRLALGATPTRLATTLVGEGVLIVSAGLAAGLLAALSLSRYLTSELYGVTPTSPAVYATVAALVLTAGTLAAFLPVRRYCSVDARSVLSTL